MNKKLGNLFKGDKGIWMVFFFLCLISIIEVFSASSTLSYKSQNFMAPIIYHAGTLAFGILLTIVVLNIPCRYFKLMTPLLIFLSFATLLWVLAFGESINGANRVIQLPGFTFQPSELAKGTMVLATAQILSAMQREDGKGADSKAMKYVLWLVLPTIMLIGIENLSTAVLLFGVIFIMMFIGRVPMVQIGKLTGCLVLLVGIFLTLVLTIGSMDDQDEQPSPVTTEMTVAQAQQAEEDGGEGLFAKIFHRFGTWRNRLLNHSDRPDDPKEYSVRDNFQVAHSNFAIASSSIIGKGPGNSEEREYLPQAFSDFIFSIIIEEMGLIGAIAVVFLYIILLIRAARIAGRCENNFPAFLVMGLAILLVAQASINMMVAVGIGPVTGQPLPLVSKGGTSTLVSCVYIGAILSVSRSAKRRDVATANDYKKDIE
ncbi:MAG: FtsW/RodA/SpoVE family cell cycle protein [Prevotella sp.]|nr:FtsW/RodA/SpoVE family cell cycle protein [Prevotella sp.]